MPTPRILHRPGKPPVDPGLRKMENALSEPPLPPDVLKELTVTPRKDLKILRDDRGMYTLKRDATGWYRDYIDICFIGAAAMKMEDKGRWTSISLHEIDKIIDEKKNPNNPCQDTDK